MQPRDSARRVWRLHKYPIEGTRKMRKELTKSHTLFLSPVPTSLVEPIDSPQRSLRIPSGEPTDSVRGGWGLHKYLIKYARKERTNDNIALWSNLFVCSRFRLPPPAPPKGGGSGSGPSAQAGIERNPRAGAAGVQIKNMKPCMALRAQAFADRWRIRGLLFEYPSYF